MWHMQRKHQTWLGLHTIWWPANKDFPELKQMTFSKTALQDVCTRPVQLFSLFITSVYFMERKCPCLHFPNPCRRGKFFFWLWPFGNSFIMVPWAFEGLECPSFTKVFLSSELLLTLESHPNSLSLKAATLQATLLITHLLPNSSKLR